MIANVYGGSSSLSFFDCTDQIGNANQVFSIPAYKKGTLLVFWNGLIQRLSSEITEVSNSTFETSFIPQLGSILAVYFQPL